MMYLDKETYLKIRTTTFLAVAPIKPRTDIFFGKTEEEKKEIRNALIEAAKKGKPLPD